jgi:16S rRNA (cytosine1402-N4)-methyltransferase
VRLHVVRHPADVPDPVAADGVDPGVAGPDDRATDVARVSPDHPSLERSLPPPAAAGDTPATISAITSATQPDASAQPTRTRTRRRRSTSGGSNRGPGDRSAIETERPRRPTPYESGLAAVARRDVHIERVWPMRSPSTGYLEASSSAYFQRERRGTPPATIVPVEGLQMSQTFQHEPVMASEVVDLFGPVPAGLVVDATLGGGGHAAALLSAWPHLRILGIDRDPAAVEAATAVLARFGDRAVIRQSRFDVMAHVIEEVSSGSADQPSTPGLSGVLFDLGVSSPQLDIAERGFSYRRDASLDMRMDPTTGRTAADVVNHFDEDALVDLFADNGEGRFARRIARAIIAARPLSTTGQLADVVRTAIPAATRRTGGHPARRVFQAIRIAVNEELDQLETALDDATALLQPGGRCVVIAYHSGEDRLVKSIFQRLATDDCHCPPGLPCVCGANPQFRLVARGARRPTAPEVERNPRAEAARLRVIERITPLETGATARVAPGSGDVA